LKTTMFKKTLTRRGFGVGGLRLATGALAAFGGAGAGFGRPARAEDGQGADGLTFERIAHAGAEFDTVRVDATKVSLRTFLLNTGGAPFGGFSPLAEQLEAQGRTLLFAMNGGMYDAALLPVGLYVEDGEALKPLNTRPGPGNFHMLPNGVFAITDAGPLVRESKAFAASSGPPARFATQSGPMLVIDGALHPRFYPESRFLNVRNGVGIVEETGEAVFAISTSRVNFWSFARFFKDRLGCRNALYLDGTISSLYAPPLRRRDWLFPMGPIIAVVG